MRSWIFVVIVCSPFVCRHINIYIIKDDRSIYTIDLLGLKEMKIEIDEWKQRERREKRDNI